MAAACRPFLLPHSRFAPVGAPVGLCIKRCFRPDALIGSQRERCRDDDTGCCAEEEKPEPSAEETAAKELVRLAREQGLSLTGPDGLLKQFTKSVLETALNEEMTEHLGHEKHRAPEERESSNIRNGTRPKTVLTEATGQVQIEVPRDRDGTFRAADREEAATPADRGR